MADTVAAVVVTYNRKELLAECLDALLGQTRPVDKIILIDNASTDGTPEFLDGRGYLSNLVIDYVRLPENTGGAGGFHEGVKKGYEQGYDWLWLMDDDAEPKPNALELLSEYFSAPSIIALANLNVGKDGTPQYGHRGWLNLCGLQYGVLRVITDKDILSQHVQIDFSSFVGIAINRKAVRSIGLPHKDFFIHADDTEYCCRLRKQGIMLMIPNSIIVHKDEANKKSRAVIRFGRKSMRVDFEDLWITYYGIRNLTWLRKKYCNNYLISILIMYSRILLKIIIFNDNMKYMRMKFYSHAIIDGLRGTFDNKKPKILLKR